MSRVSKNESKGTDICALVSQGKHNFDAQALATVHASLEHPLVEHAPVLPLSQNDFLPVICDSSLANYLSQLDHDSDTLNSKSESSIAPNHVILIGSSSEEMRLLSSLNILGLLNLMFYAI